MFVRGTTQSWYLSQDTSEAIDFCFRALQEDGLSSPPFDQHPDGDGSLRTVGMTAESWLTWLMDVLQLEREQKQAIQQWTQDCARPFERRLWRTG